MGVMGELVHGMFFKTVGQTSVLTLPFYFVYFSKVYFYISLVHTICVNLNSRLLCLAVFRIVLNGKHFIPLKGSTKH